MRKKLFVTYALMTMLAVAGCSATATDAPTSVAETTEESSEEETTTEAEDELVSELTEEQQRLLAFGAVLATRNNMDYNSIYGCDTELKEAIGDSYQVEDREQYLDTFKTSYKQALSSSWSTTDKDSAIETLDWLRDEGHRISLDEDYYGFDEILNLIRTGETEGFEDEAEAYDEVVSALKEDYGYTDEEIASVTTLSAWDYDRLVVVARWCYGSDYISEEEFWSYLEAAAAQGAADYDSWRTCFAGALMGRAIWSGENGFDSANQAVADQLLSDEGSIYQKVSFK